MYLAIAHLEKKLRQITDHRYVSRCMGNKTEYDRRELERQLERLLKLAKADWILNK